LFLLLLLLLPQRALQSLSLSLYHGKIISCDSILYIEKQCCQVSMAESNLFDNSPCKEVAQSCGL
jgi:hypothetical protein